MRLNALSNAWVARKKQQLRLRRSGRLTKINTLPFLINNTEYGQAAEFSAAPRNSDAPYFWLTRRFP